MHRKEETHSNGSYERKSRRQAWLTTWNKVKKIPRYTHRLMHQKRVTSKLHDSYFRLMTIKHAIPKIEWAIGLLYNSVMTGSQRVGFRRIRVEMWQGKLQPAEGAHGTPDGVWGPDQLVIRCSRESQQRGPPGLRLSSHGERERHNAYGHKSGGQYIGVLFGLQLTRLLWFRSPSLIYYTTRTPPKFFIFKHRLNKVFIYVYYIPIYSTNIYIYIYIYINLGYNQFYRN